MHTLTWPMPTILPWSSAARSYFFCCMAGVLPDRGILGAGRGALNCRLTVVCAQLIGRMCALVVAEGELPLPSLTRSQQFGPILEMHRVVVIPLAAPDEAVLLEGRDDLLRHAVVVRDLAGMRTQEPVIRELEIEIAYHNRMPKEIVATFEKHGFIWGGKWYHYDTM